MASAAAWLRWRSHAKAAKSSSQMKKRALPLRLLLAFSQRAPSPVKVSQTFLLPENMA